MPDIDTLLGEWPPEVEEVILKEQGMPLPDLDCDLASYVDIACGKILESIYYFKTDYPSYSDISSYVSYYVYAQAY